MMQKDARYLCGISSVYIGCNCKNSKTFLTAAKKRAQCTLLFISLAERCYVMFGLWHDHGKSLKVIRNYIY